MNIELTDEERELALEALRVQARYSEDDAEKHAAILRLIERLR